MEIAAYIAVGLMVIIVLVAFRNRKYLKDLMQSMDEILQDSRDDVPFPKEVATNLAELQEEREPRWPHNIKPIFLPLEGVLLSASTDSQYRLSILTDLMELEQKKAEPDQKLIDMLQQARLHESDLGASLFLAHSHVLSTRTTEQPAT